MRLFAALFFALFVVSAASAQDRPNTILVMDGSGSMWGQIDGVAKITIAQDVVRDLLTTLPETDRLGLTVYGHRQRGDCSDIETVVAPGPNTRDAIAAAVGSIQPLGKTPMTDAVIAAAEALRYTEDSATVILVSDGVETCNPDPCAAARLLEQAGIDFTAHVIGFDISGDAEALAQMQCIADETGGLFIPASNAGELTEALNTVVEDPEPIVVTGTFRAVLGDDSGPLIQEPILWDVTSDAGVIVTDQIANPLTADLREGTYTATAYRLIDEVELSADFTVTGTSDVTVIIAFPEIQPTATLDAPDSAPAGSTVMVGWTGPNEINDNVQVVLPDGGYFDYEYTAKGNPAALILPAQPGTYELHYVLNDRDTIGTRTIEVTEIELGLDFPATVPVGSDFQVAWVGPNAGLDNIQVGPIEGGYSSYAYTDRGNPVTITAPTEPGLYEVRYRFLDRETIFTKPIDVTDIKSALIAPQSAQAGSTISVGWDGPDYAQDFISVGTPGERGYVNYTYTRDGNPLDLVLPTEPGTYELRYQLRQDNEVIATRPIEVTAVTATIEAPDQAVAGSSVTVDWTGPDYPQDFIAVGEPGERGYVNYTYTRDGTTLQIVMPTEPGVYELRYTMRQDNAVLITRPIEVIALQSTVTAPSEATAGSTISVAWNGPDYPQDFIAVAEVGERGYVNYTYTRDGSPLDLVMPTEPGDYEIRYTLRQDSEVIATSPITITPVKAALTIPATAKAGEAITVEWDGPDYPQDFIAVGEVGDRGYENYTYTRDGSPLELVMPALPGTYEVRYTMRQDSTVIYRQQIEVQPVKAQLVAPASGTAGGELVVGWDGPDYPQDFIAISKVGDDRGYETYVYTRNGNPVSVRLPDAPGAYEVRYFMRQDSTIIARVPLTVTE